MCRYLLKKEGLFLGGSAGLNVAAAYLLAKKLGPGHTIVTILCGPYTSKISPSPDRSSSNLRFLQSQIREIDIWRKSSISNSWMRRSLLLDLAMIYHLWRWNWRETESAAEILCASRKFFHSDLPNLSECYSEDTGGVFTFCYLDFSSTGTFRKAQWGSSLSRAQFRVKYDSNFTTRFASLFVQKVLSPQVEVLGFDRPLLMGHIHDGIDPSNPFISPVRFSDQSRSLSGKSKEHHCSQRVFRPVNQRGVFSWSLLNMKAFKRRTRNRLQRLPRITLPSLEASAVPMALVLASRITFEFIKL